MTIVKSTGLSTNTVTNHNSKRLQQNAMMDHTLEQVHGPRLEPVTNDLLTCTMTANSGTVSLGLIYIKYMIL